MTDTITVHIRTVDRANRSRSFKTPKGALAFLTKWVGNPAGAEGNVLVSFDGVVVGYCSHDIGSLVTAASVPTKAEVSSAEALELASATETANILNRNRKYVDDRGVELERALMTARDVLDLWQSEAEYEMEMAKQRVRYD
jgi:hypothetical protein